MEQLEIPPIIKKIIFKLKLVNLTNEEEYLSETDSNGNYIFDNVKSGNYILNILNDNYQQNNKFDVKIIGKTTASFFVSQYCQYNYSNGICPICKSKKNVLQIIYGLPNEKFWRKNKKKYHLGGCEITICDPKWYCEKDRVEF